MSKRVRAIYSGRVQGVGFRFTVIRLAEDLKVLGWVKNLPDGRVEAVAEGNEPELRSFLSRIREDFKNYIIGTDLIWLEATGEFSAFNIKY